MEVIGCHDCDGAVSPSAAACPHCGSSQPWGPYRFNSREARKFRIEHRNDNNLVRTTLLVGFIGVLYGIVVARKSGGDNSWHGVQGAFIAVNAAWYGFLGILVGVPLAATINMYRSARHFLVPVVLVILFVAYEFGLLRLQ